MGLGNHEVGSYIEAFGASTDAEGGKFSFRRSSSIREEIIIQTVTNSFQFLVSYFCLT